MALRQLRDGYDIVALLTTVTQGYDRISMHGVPRVLLERQAAALGLPLEEVWIPRSCTNLEYEERMEEVLRRYLRQGVEAVAFGDIFLEDLRRYREEKLAQVGLEGIFPLWKRPTLELAREFIRLGFRATICCVDSQALPGSFAGREFDGGFLAELPPSVDPCGERGEFHSFVHYGPLFAWPVRFTKGPTVLREERFYYCDLIPEDHGSASWAGA